MKPDALSRALPALNPAREAVRRAWTTQSARDQRMLKLVAAVLGLFLLWSLAIAPAWRTLATLPAQRDAQDAQWQQMQALAGQAQALRGAAPVNNEQAQAALNAATARLGSAGKLSLQGQRALLSLKGANADQLRNWLAESRAGARARVVEATLTQTAPGVFDGSLTVALGGRQ